jgi:hypothetical protein
MISVIQGQNIGSEGYAKGMDWAMGVVKGVPRGGGERWIG